MHLGNNSVVIVTRHILGERCAVDVKGGITESVRRIPKSTGVGRYKVKSTGGMIEIREINVRGSLINHLILSLGDQDLVLLIGKELTLFGVKVGIHGVHLGGGGKGAITALDAYLHIVVLHSN